MAERTDIRDLATLLARDCERLFLRFVPDAKMDGGELRGHGPDGAKWTMAVRGAKRGLFCNWGASDQKGDCIELIHAACWPGRPGRSDAYQFGMNWLGLAPGSSDPADVERIRQAKERARAEQAARDSRDEAERLRKRGIAQRVYLDHRNRDFEHAPELADYLQTRGLPIDLLSEPLSALRFTRFAYYDPEHAEVPAMLAPVIDPVTRRYKATHTTFLEYRDGHWRNARFELRRRTLGDKQGGIIPLLRGASRKRLRHAPEGDTLLMAEGIENAIAAALCCPDVRHLPDEPRVWSAIDVGNLQSIELPDVFTSMILVRDQDEVRYGAYREAVCQAWLEEGRSVQQMAVPAGFKDFNEYVARLAAAAA